jgi:hypothetical protein
MQARIRKLRIVAALFRGLAWIVLAAGVILGFLVLVGVLVESLLGIPALPLPRQTATFGGIVGLVLALLGFALLYGTAALLRLLLSVEAKARELANLLGEEEARR